MFFPPTVSLVLYFNRELVPWARKRNLLMLPEIYAVTKATVEKRKRNDRGGKKGITSKKGAYDKACGFLGRKRLFITLTLHYDNLGNFKKHGY